MRKAALLRGIDTYPQASKGAGARPDLPWPIEMVRTTDLRPPTRKIRTHSEPHVDLIADSLRQFGVIGAIVVDRRNRIVAGYGRWMAAQRIGLKFIPVIRLEHLSDDELRAYALADNQIATKAGWDRELLAIELSELQLALPEIGLDISSTGFDPGEIDAILEDFREDAAEPSDELPEVSDGPAVCRTGDVIILGKHRLLVGDARDADAYACLMQREIADMAIHDPPYNVRIQGNVGGRGRTKHREFVCASGEMSPAQFTEFLKETLGHGAGYSADGAITYVFMDWRHIGELLAAGAVAFDELKNVCVWDKGHGAQGNFYRSQHEFVACFKQGDAPHLNNFGLGAGGRTRTNVWRYAGMAGFRAGRMDELRMHPTVKPVAMYVDMMRDCSRRGSIILDAFAGSGTTIMAAEQVGRHAYCMEIDPRYADVAVRRWQAFTRRDATLEGTRQTFDALAKLRSRGSFSADQEDVTDAAAKPRQSHRAERKPRSKANGAARRDRAVPHKETRSP